MLLKLGKIILTIFFFLLSSFLVVSVIESELGFIATIFSLIGLFGFAIVLIAFYRKKLSTKVNRIVASLRYVSYFKGLKMTRGKIASLSFLILAYFGGGKILLSELPFVMTVFYFIGLLIMVGIIFYFYGNRPSSKAFFKNSPFVFLFISISLFCLYNLFFTDYLIKKERQLSSGTFLFFVYFMLTYTLKLEDRIDIYISLLSLSFIPVLTLAKLYYTAETFAVFAFLIQLRIALRLLLLLRINYETA